MRDFDSSDEYDVATAERLKAESWQLELLELNPDYVYWGPREDYMYKREGTGWDSRLIYGSWAACSISLDDLNEVVNFYFEVDRDSAQCPDCQGGGYNPETARVAAAFYEHSCPPDMKPWHTDITQDEVEALVAEERLWDFTDRGKKTNADGTPYVPSAVEVNAAQQGVRSHDAINRSVLVRTRAERLGVYGLCETCGGHGHAFTSAECHVNLVLWLLHPRKGASRGVEVRITRDDLPDIYAFLREAAERNAARFSRIPG